ncbi:hypothetical protein GF373_07325 [bacterium]|nr:hypothetical protein [bacterium]
MDHSGQLVWIKLKTLKIYEDSREQYEIVREVELYPDLVTNMDSKTSEVRWSPMFLVNDPTQNQNFENKFNGIILLLFELYFKEAQNFQGLNNINSRPLAFVILIGDNNLDPESWLKMKIVPLEFENPINVAQFLTLVCQEASSQKEG